jgi:hypothetical protein
MPYEPKPPATNRPADIEYWRGWLFGPDCGGGERLARLIGCYDTGTLGIGVLRAVLPDIWGLADAPLLGFSALRLVRLFTDTGFLADDPSVSAPAAELAVFRGCHPATSHGVSWTTSPVIARAFCGERGDMLALRARFAGALNRRHALGSPTVRHRVYTAIAPPKSILALFSSRGEGEVIVNPRLLLNRRELQDRESDQDSQRDHF